MSQCHGRNGSAMGFGNTRVNRCFYPQATEVRTMIKNTASQIFLQSGVSVFSFLLLIILLA